MPKHYRTVGRSIQEGDQEERGVLVIHRGEDDKLRARMIHKGGDNRLRQCKAWKECTGSSWGPVCPHKYPHRNCIRVKCDKDNFGWCDEVETAADEAHKILNKEK